MLSLLLLCAAAGCTYAYSLDRLPEGLIICGAVIGFFLMVNAAFLFERTIAKRQMAEQVGSMIYQCECMVRMGRKRSVRCQVAICTAGMVMDAGSHWYACTFYYEMESYMDYLFEVRFRADGTDWRFLFDQAVRAKSMQEAIALARKVEEQEDLCDEKESFAF